MSEEEGSFWGSTIGNTFLADVEKRSALAEDWTGFKEHMLPHAVEGEWAQRLSRHEKWTAQQIAEIGHELAEAAGQLWYGDGA